MSKTSQENKKKKLAVEETVVVDTTTRNADAPADTSLKADTSAVETTENTTKIARVRSKKYQAVKKLIDINKSYPLQDAVELIKKTSFAKFNGKIEAHVTILDIGNAGEIVFPHLELGHKKIVILNDTILAEIKNGQINFDILIATPATMPKLLPFARLLGPKGLMPNPKNGTLTDKPEEAVTKLSVAKTLLKTEKKAPVLHLVVGQISQPDTEIVANITELIKIVKPAKIKKLALCATMGPSVKIEIIK